MATKLPIWDRRMFELMDTLLNDPGNKMTLQMDFFKKIGIKHPSSITQIKDGKQSFRIQNFKLAGDQFGVSMDWFFGFTDRMDRADKKTNPLSLLKEATRLIETQLMNGTAVNTRVNNKPAKLTRTKK